jgi:threonine dehydrogenase-like Zn-dependent dehydrogenase
MADRTLWPVPEAVSSEDAVFVADILPTALAGVQRGGVGIGDLVVVLGCGPVGLMAVLCATGTARTVIAVDGVPERRRLAASLGAEAVEPADAAEAVAAASDGMGADVVIEAAGALPALDASFRLARAQGVISVIGAHFEPDYPLDNALMFEKELTLRFSIGNPGRDRERLFAAIEAGRMTPSKVLTHRVGIDDAAEAYRAFDAREMTKVVLTT